MSCFDLRYRALLPLAAALVVAGCEGETTAPPQLVSGQVEIDASSNTAYTFLNLASGQVVTVANPGTSQEWDLAMRRFEVRLNGGVSGPNNVTGFNLANNAGATPAQVLAFTPDNQKPAFDAVGVAQIPAAAQFVAEALAANPLGWLSFGAQGPVANANAVWKLKRSGSGGYSAFHVTALTLNGSGQSATLGSVTVEWRYQSTAGGALNPKQQSVVNVASGNNVVNLSTGVTGTAAGCDWDIQFGAQDFSITPNTSCAVGTFPLDATQAFDALATASDAPQYGAFLAGRTGAVPYTTALDNPNGPFLYNLAGDNRLSPTFNIYLIKVGTAVYKFQLINYYSATGTSGHPTIRYAQIQ